MARPGNVSRAGPLFWWLSEGTQDNVVSVLIDSRPSTRRRAWPNLLRWMQRILEVGEREPSKSRLATKAMSSAREESREALQAWRSHTQVRCVLATIP